MKSLYILIFTTLSLVAEEVEKNNFISNFLGALLPIFVFFGIWIILAKKMGNASGVKEAADSNLELADSNLKVATQLKRIADILEKKEN